MKRFFGFSGFFGLFLFVLFFQSPFSFSQERDFMPDNGVLNDSQLSTEEGIIHSKTFIHTPSPHLRKLLMKAEVEKKGDYDALWSVTRQILLYRKYFLSSLWSLRLEMQTELLLLGIPAVQSDSLQQETQKFVYGLPDFYAQKILPHNSLLENQPLEQTLSGLQSILFPYLQQSLAILDFEREIKKHLDKISSIYFPNGILEHHKTYRQNYETKNFGPRPLKQLSLKEEKIVAQEERAIEELRKTQQIFNYINLLYTPQPKKDLELQQMGGNFYSKVVLELPNVYVPFSKNFPRFFSPQTTLAHKLGFIALLQAQRNGIDVTQEWSALNYFKKQPLDSDLLLLARDKVAEAIRNALLENEKAILNFYYLSHPNWLQRFTLGKFSNSSKRLDEPSNDIIEEIFSQFISAIPFFVRSEDFHERIEADYGIPLTFQRKADSILMETYSSWERKRKNEMETYEKMFGVSAFLFFPLSFVGAPSILLGYGLFQGIWWLLVTTDHQNPAKMGASLAKSSFWAINNQDPFSITLDELQNAQFLEREALQEYFFSLALIGADLASFSYLKFIKKVRWLGGREVLAIDQLVAKDLREVAKESLEQYRYAIQFLENGDFLNFEKALHNFGKINHQVASTITKHEYNGIQILTDSLWKERADLEKKIKELAKKLMEKQPGLPFGEKPWKIMVQGEPLFELPHASFSKQIANLGNFIPNKTLQQEYLKLFEKRWAIEQFQTHSLSYLTSPRTSPFVRKMSNTLEKSVGKIPLTKGAHAVQRTATAIPRAISKLVVKKFPNAAEAIAPQNVKFASFLKSFSQWADQKGVNVKLKKIVNFWTEMEYPFIKRWSTGLHISQGNLRRTMQVLRDMLFWDTAGDWISRKNANKQFYEIGLNKLVGFTQATGRTVLSTRASISFVRRLTIGGSLTIASSTIGMMMLNTLIMGDDIFSDECIGVMFRRGIGNTAYALAISEGKARLAESFRLATETILGKDAPRANIIITGINISEKFAGGLIWGTISQLADMQGRCHKQETKRITMDLQIPQISAGNFKTFWEAIHMGESVNFGKPTDEVYPPGAKEYFDSEG